MAADDEDHVFLPQPGVVSRFYGLVQGLKMGNLICNLNYQRTCLDDELFCLRLTQSYTSSSKLREANKRAGRTGPFPNDSLINYLALKGGTFHAWTVFIGVFKALSRKNIQHLALQLF